MAPVANDNLQLGPDGYSHFPHPPRLAAHYFIHPSHSERPSGATHSDVIKVLAEPFHLTNNPESFNLFAKFQVLRTQNSLKRLSETPAASVNIFSTNKEDFPLYYLL